MNGFCDYDLNFMTDSPKRGTYNWAETEVNLQDAQDCFYGEVTIGMGQARRYCIAHNQWNMYNGEECITLATFRLRQISEVGSQK